MKILTICPSLNRPNMLKEMVDSFDATITTDNTLIVVDDPITPTECFNKVLLDNSNYDFYHLTNDDVIYKTKGWDDLLSRKGKICYGNDTIQGDALCTFPMIDGDIVRCLGWLQLPTLKKYCGDVVWMELGRRLNCLKYVPDVEIEHRHFVNGKRENDDPNFWGTYGYDKEAFLEWFTTSAVFDTEAIRRYMKW